jgi:hypothetical protein
VIILDLMTPQVIPANGKQNVHFSMEAQAFAIGGCRGQKKQR